MSRHDTTSRRLATIAAIACLTGACASNTTQDDPEPTTQKENTMSTRDLVLATTRALFTDFDAEAAGRLLAPDYIQHNPGVPTGAAPVLGFLPVLKEAGLSTDVHRVFVDGDFVFMHTTYTNAQPFGAPTLVGFDVFRVADGKVAEHWDNLQAPPASTTSGRSMTDGPTEATDLDETEANKALITRFADDVLLGGNFAALPEYIASGPGEYHQHNPDIGDGLDGLGAGFARLAEAGKAIAYTRVHKVLGQGNFVLTMAEGTMGDEPTAYYDLFRVADGKIVEHWDVIAPIPAEMAHQNGKF